MRILVTDAHEMAGLGTVRSLGRAGHEVTAASPVAATPAAASRFCRRSIVSPNPWLDQPAYREWLSEQAGRYDLVFPVTEAAVVAAAAIPNALVPPQASLPFVLSKRACTLLAAEVGLTCPATATDRSTAGLIRLPAIVKTDNYLHPDGRYVKGKTWYVRDAEERDTVLDECEDSPWLVQEYLPGYGAGAFILRWEGRTVLTFAHRRIHEVPFWGGWSSLRESVAAPDLVAAAERLLNAFGFAGAGMVEFRVSGGIPYFLEVNGRMWGSLALALHAGADFPRALVECWREGNAPAAKPRIGVRCRNLYPGEVGYVRSVLRGSGPVRGIARPSKPGAIAGLFLCRARGDFFWASDPRPALRQGVVAFTAFRSALGRKLHRAIARRRAERFSVERTQHHGGPVLFLCYGNICRSPFAEVLWRLSVGPDVSSSGFHATAGRPTPKRIARLALSLGIDLSNHRSRVVTLAEVRRAGTIYVMDASNLEALLRFCPEANAKTRVLSVVDPYDLDNEGAARALKRLHDLIPTLIDRRGGCKKT